MASGSTEPPAGRDSCILKRKYQPSCCRAKTKFQERSQQIMAAEAAWSIWSIPAVGWDAGPSPVLAHVSTGLQRSLKFN